MTEPHLSRFRELIRAGAGTLDIHDGQSGSSFTREAQADDALVTREVGRVDVHLHSLCRLLALAVPIPLGNVLDVGCGTGATTVAVALDSALGGREIVGVDPNRSSLRAAAVRAAGYSLAAPRVRFVAVDAGAALPFEDGEFELVLCVSVIEYIHAAVERQRFATDLLRVARPGGHICLVTPSPYRLFDYHTHRWLGDWRRVEGFPWASRRHELRALFRGHAVQFLDREQFEVGLGRRGIGGSRIARMLAPLAPLLPWQKLLVRRSADGR